MLCSNMPDDTVGADEAAVHFNIRSKLVFRFFKKKRLERKEIMDKRKDKNA